MMSLSGGKAAPSSHFVDNDNYRLREKHPQPHQGICADVIATLEGISREALDELALMSQQRADNAIKNGHFSKSLVPVTNVDGSLALDYEEFPRPETTLQTLASLKPSFEAIVDHPLDEAGTTYKSLIHKVYPRSEPRSE